MSHSRPSSPVHRATLLGRLPGRAARAKITPTTTLPIAAFLLLLAALAFVPGSALAQEVPTDLGAIADLGLAPSESEFLRGLTVVPATPAELDAYSRGEQKLIFRALSADAKSAYWTRKLERYLDSHPELERDQETLVRHAISVVTPQFFALQPGDLLYEPVVEKAIEGLSAVATRVFEVEEIAALFVRLGNTPAECAPAEKARRGRADEKISCDCLWGTDCIVDCTFGCSSTTSGCGWFGAQRCTKWCAII